MSTEMSAPSQQEEDRTCCVVENGADDGKMDAISVEDKPLAKEEAEETKPGLDFRGLGPVYQSVFLDVMGIRNTNGGCVDLR